MLFKGVPSVGNGIFRGCVMVPKASVQLVYIYVVFSFGLILLRAVLSKSCVAVVSGMFYHRPIRH